MEHKHVDDFTRSTSNEICYEMVRMGFTYRAKYFLTSTRPYRSNNQNGILCLMNFRKIL